MAPGRVNTSRSGSMPSALMRSIRNDPKENSAAASPPRIP